MSTEEQGIPNEEVIQVEDALLKRFG